MAVRAGMELAEPEYWNPSSLFDYSAATLTTVNWIVTGVAFILWSHTTPIRWSSILLMVAGIGIAVSGVGNVLEDVVNLGFGELLFTFGGMVGVIGVLMAAVSILAVRSPLRWSALPLLLFVVGAAFPDSGGQFLTGASLIALGLLLSASSADLRSRLLSARWLQPQ